MTKYQDEFFSGKPFGTDGDTIDLISTVETFMWAELSGRTFAQQKAFDIKVALWSVTSDFPFPEKYLIY